MYVGRASQVVTERSIENDSSFVNQGIPGIPIDCQGYKKSNDLVFV